MTSAALAEAVRDHCSLYRYFDKNDELLYVGITSRGLNRSHQHAASQPWWHLVVRSTVEHFSRVAFARMAEKRAIATERPLFNLAGADHRQRPHRVWAGAAEPTILPVAEDPASAADEAERRLALAAQEFVASLIDVVRARPSVLTDTSAPVLMSVAEAARRLGISRSTAYMAVADGSLKTIKVRGRRLVAEPELARIARTA